MSVVTILGTSGWSPAEMAVVLIIFCILRAAFAFCKPGYNPSKVPVIGLPSGLFGRLRAVPLVFGRSHQMVMQGFSRYCKGENPTVFLTPWFLTNYVHILPPELVSEHKSVPEDILSFTMVFEDVNGVLAMGGRQIIDNPFHTAIIRQKLTMSLERLLEPVHEELEVAFKEEWEQQWVGKEQEGGWVDIPAFHVATMGIVARTTNRAFSGMSLCRDRDFLKNVVDYAVGIVLAGYGVQLCPSELQWLLEPLLAFRNRRRIAFAVKKMRPIIEERKAIIDHNIKNKENQINAPKDLLQDLIEEAEKLSPEDKSIKALTIYYLAVNFVALHTTSMAFAHTMGNLAAYRDSTGQSYWDLIHEEVLAVDRESEEGPGNWTKKKLNRLVGVDSFIRESLRLDMSPPVGLIRKVISKEGYTYSNGLHLKQEAFVGVPALCIHTDQDSIKAGTDATEFDGFRFSRPYQELVVNAPATDISATSGVGKHAAVTTNDQYLAFGHGKHACPGRFFAIWVLKLFLIHCVLNYEVKTQERVPARFIWGQQVSHMDIKLKMRMRKGIGRK